MTLQVKGSSGWQEPVDIQIHANGAWSGVRGGWVKQNGQWVQFWPKRAAAFSKVSLRKIWMGLADDQPVIVLEAKFDTPPGVLHRAVVYRLKFNIQHRPITEVTWRHGDLSEWDTPEADGYQSVSMNSAISSGDGALPPALATALRNVPAREVMTSEHLRRNHWKHWGGLPMTDLPVSICMPGQAQLMGSCDNGVTWCSSEWVTIDTYLNLADVTPVIERDDERAPAFVPRIRYKGTPLSYIPYAQLLHVRIGWEVWVGGDAPPTGAGRAECMEMPNAYALSCEPSKRRVTGLEDVFDWGAQYNKKGFVLACPPGLDPRCRAVGQEWWRGYRERGTTRVHPLNILQSRVSEGPIYSKPGSIYGPDVVRFENAWECRGSYWRYCVVDETPGKPPVHRFSEVVHWGMPTLSATSPQVDLTSDYRVRIVSPGAVPTLSASNVLLPGRQTPIAANPSQWMPDDGWTIRCGYYTGGTYGPLNAGEILRFGPEMLPMCHAELLPRFPTQQQQDWFDTFDPLDGIHPVGGIVSLKSNWAVALPGFETSGSPLSSLDQGIYLTRIPLTAWADIGARTGPPPPLVITKHPRIVYQGSQITQADDGGADASGGVPPRTWGEWYWECSTNDQATWHLLAGTEVEAGTWVRICCDVTDAAGSTAKAQSNTLMMGYDSLFWGTLPTVELSSSGTGMEIRITQYSYGGGKEPYTDSRHFEGRQNGAWQPFDSSANYTGRWEFRAVCGVTSADGQTLHYETPAKTWDFGGGQNNVIGSHPTVSTYPVIRVERDGPNVGDMVWARCVQPAAVSIPPDASFWYTAEYRLSNGGVITHYDSRTDQQTPGDTKGFTHGTVQLVYSYTITSSSYGTVHLDAPSNTVDYDLRVFIDNAGSSGGHKDLQCHRIDNPNSRAVCEALQKYYNSL